MKIRVFVSSPGDVADERAAARGVLEGMSRQYQPLHIDIEPVFWEDKPLTASETFQQQLVLPSKCEIVICILWARIGRQLPSDFQRDDGTRYESGTVFEFEDALRAAKAGKTDFFVYCKQAPLRLDLTDTNTAEIQKRVDQKSRLDAFLKRCLENDDGSLKGASHRFSKVGEFEKLLEKHIHAVIKRRSKDLDGNVVPDELGPVPLGQIWADGSPFRGLERFEMEHAAAFFGREEAIEEVRELVIQRLRENCCSFLLIAGSSGSGKSSFIHAGILPRLMRAGSIADVSIWSWATMRPGDEHGDPIAGLARALLRPHAVGNELEKEGLHYESLVKLLEQDATLAGETINRFVSSSVASVEGDAASENRLACLVLVVDQLEEIFAVTPQPTGRKRVEQFVRILSALSQQPEPGVLVIAALRSDFYRRCGEIRELTTLNNAGKTYHLHEPTHAEFARIIRRPALAAGLTFEDNLDDEILQDAMANPDSLPLLEFTLKLLHKSCSPDNVLTREAYKQIGGVEGAIQRRAHDILCGLEEDVRKALPHVLKSLVRIDLREDCAAKRNASVAAISGSHAKAAQFVEAFADARLLVLDKDGDGAPVVSVVHEALVRRWEDAQDWIQENRKFLRFRERATEAAIRWIRSDRAPSELMTEGSFLVEAEEFLAQKEIDLGEPVTEEFVAECRDAAEQRRHRRLAPLRVLFASWSCAIFGYVGCAIALLGNSSLLYEGLNGEDDPQAIIGTSVGAAIGGLFWGICGVSSWEIARVMREKHNPLRDFFATVAGGVIGSLIPAVLITYSWGADNAYLVFLVGGAVWGALLGIGLLVRQSLAQREFEPFGNRGLLVGAACFFFVLCLTTLTTLLLGRDWPISWGQGLIFASGHMGVFVGLFLTDVFSARVYR